jgi:DNA-directed RNA polymerase subunit beta
MDVSPMQIMSVSAALIPFLEHDDANRALMGSNMQRQAVPLLRPQAPVVGTGIESRVARDSGHLVLSEVAGVVTSVTGREIIVTDEEGVEFSHPVIKFSRTNQGTCFDQRPISTKGDVVDVGSVLADSSSTDHGELALGQNVLVAFMSWEGYNYEDAIIVSERLYRDDYFTSIHIEKHEMEARETKLGPEEITRDIPNVGENSLRDLDDLGIIRVGADVGPGDILVGKVTPKGETELTAEEKLLRAIFGEKSRDVKDTSLRVPHGERGKVIDVKVLTRENRDDLSPGVNQAVRVWIAQTRKISVGDKMAGRHGNKGVVARILPEEDMPYMADGTPVDIILNPIGVPSRMNLGQVLETHLGWAARGLNFRANTPVFDGAGDQQIEDALARVWFTEQSGAAHIGTKEILPEVDYSKVNSWLEERGYDPTLIFDESKFGLAQEACLRMWLTEEAGVDAKDMNLVEMQRAAIDVHREQRIAPPTFGKFELSDGRSGENFDQLVTVGNIYILKLIHLVEDKIHARSTGPYSMITQQPLGGKAQFGGQRVGEMEVWALEAYSAAYNLQEVLTVKSDDVAGRVKTYEAIVKGEPIGQPGVPESFNVLLKELQSLGLAVELLNEENRPPTTPGQTYETDLFQALETI